MGIAVDRGTVIVGQHIQSYDPSHDKRDHGALFESWFGEKCPDRLTSCACCHAWHIFEQYWLMMQEIVDDANYTPPPEPMSPTTP